VCTVLNATIGGQHRQTRGTYDHPRPPAAAGEPVGDDDREQDRGVAPVNFGVAVFLGGDRETSAGLSDEQLDELEGLVALSSEQEFGWSGDRTHKPDTVRALPAGNPSSPVTQ
jgi:hypothetical protein